MRTKLLKGAGFLAAVAVFGLVCVIHTKAQSIAGQSSASSLTINWIGNLVVGKNDPIDQIARGLFPTTVQQVEVGLRSDGVVIWRKAAPTK
jgi:hypothetical protein